MPDEKEPPPAPYAINVRAFLLAGLISCGLVAIAWLTSGPHIAAQ